MAICMSWILGLACLVPFADDEVLQDVRAYLDYQTFLVAEFRLDSIDVEAILKQYGNLVLPNDFIAEVLSIASGKGGGEKSQHIDRLYLIGRVATDWGKVFTCVLVFGEGAEVNTSFLKRLAKNVRVIALQSGKEIASFPPTSKGSWEASRVPELPDAAWKQIPNSQLRAAFWLPSDTRRVVTELGASTFPEIHLDRVAEAFEWGTISLDVPPRRTALHLRIEAADADAAEFLEETSRGAIDGLSENKSLRTDWEIPAEVVEGVQHVLPTAKGRRLEVYATGQEAEQWIEVAMGPLRAVNDSVARRMVRTHLKDIGIAINSFHEVYKSFPPTGIRGPDGQALLSWRVAILPFLDEKELYESFRLDEPWDSEHNKKLVARMPDVFAIPRSPAAREGKTYFLGTVGQRLLFPTKGQTNIRQIKDASSTLAVVEADEDHAAI